MENNTPTTQGESVVPARLKVTDEQAALADLQTVIGHLASEAPKPTWLERDNILPFHVLSDDAFEICCFMLLLREHPSQTIYYYGKTGDKGRDIVRHHTDGTIEFIQCKRYSKSVGVDEIRAELAKLCVNIFMNLLPEKPDRITFYVVPDLSSPAQDLISSQKDWRLVAAKALEDHLKAKPSAELLAFANDWWPKLDRVAGVALSIRVEAHTNLVERFFTAKKVIEGSVADLNSRIDGIKNVLTGIADVIKPQNSDGVSPLLTKSQELVGQSRNKAWEDRAKRSLDAQGLKLWEEIRSEIRELNHVKAIDAGKQLKAWLLSDGSHASATTRGRVCILLADLAIIESGITSLYERVDIAEAQNWFTRAEDELGDSPSAEDASRLVFLSARLTWLQGQSSEALKILDAAEDTNCSSLKLSILITEERDEEAAVVASALPCDDRWCDRMVLAYARCNRTSDVETVLIWAQGQPKPSVFHRCLIACAQGNLQRLFRLQDRRSLFLSPVTPAHETTLRTMQRALEPIVAIAIARGSPTSGTETEALDLLFTITRILGQREQWERYGELLAKARFASLEYARAVCRGDLKSMPDLPTRLRSDYPQSFVACHLAAVVECLNGANFEIVNLSAQALIPLANSAEQREQVAELLLERAFTEEGVLALNQAHVVAAQLLGAEHLLVRLAQCEEMRRVNKSEEATAMLESCRDTKNPVWLQMAAGDAHRRGDLKNALGYMLDAARLLGRPETYWQVFSLAERVNDTTAMKESMQTLARLTPDDPNVYRNLAAIDFRAGRYREAVTSLRRAEHLNPGTVELAVNLGQALALAGRADEAVEVLDRICATHPTTFPPYHLRALVLTSLGKPIQAFEGLHAEQERFWGDMVFVQTYHTHALRANREHEAHLAFLQMQELQAGDPNGPLRSGTLDELKKMIRGQHEHHNQLNHQLLIGLLPWVMVGQMLGREAWLDWAIRTQAMSTPDAPMARAEYAVYATNGLGIRCDEEGRRTLERVQAAASGQAIVADLSAILTLHRLGLLEQTLAYFGQVVIPANYSGRLLEECGSMQPRQASQIEAKRAILAAFDQGRLRTAVEQSKPDAILPILDEYHLDEETVDFHLSDAVDWLQRTGRITDDEVCRIQPLCHRLPLATLDVPFAKATRRGIRITVSTLSVVHEKGLLDRFLSTLRLSLEQQEIEEIRRDLLGVERRKELIQWTRELHTLLATDQRIETAKPTRQVEDEADLDGDLDSFLLADQRKLPLLVDDRCLQVILDNTRRGEGKTAFGTDALLMSLARDKKITPSEWASAWLALVRWRYRFLTPSPAVLVELAARHPNYPPGEELREVCRYLHDCCFDPGLFCGMEQVEPPVSIGWSYFREVVQAIGHFLIRAWHDPRFDQTALTALTHWTASEFVPAPPRHLPYAGYVISCDSVPRLVLIAALSEATFLDNIQQSNAALRTIADAFCISEADYEDTVAFFVERDWNLPNTSQEQDFEIVARRRAAAAALSHRGNIGIRVAMALADLGLCNAGRDRLTETDVATIGDATHSMRLEMPLGPWVFLQQTTEAEPPSAQYVPDLLFHFQLSARRAALAHLTNSAASTWLTPRSQATLTSVAADLVNENTNRLPLAARAATNALNRDFLLSLARFRQARASRMEKEDTETLRNLLEPDWTMLSSIPPQWYHPPAEEWHEYCQTVATVPTIAVALDKYYDRYGHLPLATGYAAEAIVQTWIDAHGTIGVWDHIRDWANGVCRPLAWYHVSRIFLTFPSLVPEAEQAEVWQHILTVMRSTDEDASQISLRGQVWAFLNRLAKHYLHLLEVGSHEQDATILAALAWWTAERATRQIARSTVEEYGPEQAATILRRIRLRGLCTLERNSATAWLLGRPPRPPSSFAHGTLRLNSIWQSSLLEAGPSKKLVVPTESADAIAFVLTLVGVTGFPSRLNETPSPVFASEVEFAPIANRWLDILPEANHAEASAEPASDVQSQNEISSSLLDASLQIAEPEVIAHLRAICEWESDSRQLPILRFRSAIGLGVVTPQQMQWLLVNQDWWDSVFGTLSCEQLDMLCAAVLELMRVGDEEWRLTVPHLFRAQSLRELIGVEQRQVALGAVVQATVITGHRSALDWLVRETTAAELLACIADWRRNLTSIRQVVPSPIQAMIRTTLAILPTDM